MNKIENDLDNNFPGKKTEVLSYIPIINWLSLIILGKKCGHILSLILGIIYGALSFGIPQLTVYIWIICMVQYAITYRKLKNKNISELSEPLIMHNKSTDKNIIEDIKLSEDYTSERKDEVDKEIFSNVTVNGQKEERQVIPQKEGLVAYEEKTVELIENPLSKNNYTIIEKSNLNGHNYRTFVENKFFEDMIKFKNKSERKNMFIPFDTYFPTYDSMTQEQKNWYFYWRTEVRSGNYIDTDLSYIFIHIYELLSGIGWENAEDGYKQLMKLWEQYYERFPKLNYYLLSWTFDFSQVYHLDYKDPVMLNGKIYYQDVMINCLIDKHFADRPLKLPLSYIDMLCDYNIYMSKFYKENHQSLLEESIPRVIALVDASLIKKKGKGILSLYGPVKSQKKTYWLFQSAVCPDRNKKLEISVKDYIGNVLLRKYMNGLVKFSENVLRDIYKCRGRLQNVNVEEDTAILIEKFLKKEFSPLKESAESKCKKIKIELNFDSIRELRHQSDEVREALEVKEDLIEQKELLTDVDEVETLLVTLSKKAKHLISELVQNDWKCRADNEKIETFTEINEQAVRYLACELLIADGDFWDIEEDYRDELEYIYKNRKEVSEDKGEDNEKNKFFDLNELSENMQNLIENITPEQTEIICIILNNNDIQNKINVIAEEMMSMPEIIIDEINDLALKYLDDIIIDGFADDICIFEQYEKELKKAMK